MRSPFVPLLLAAAVAAGLVGLPAAAAEDAPFAIRAVQLPGSLTRDDLESHLEHLRELGFNAVWVQARQITDDPLGESVALNGASRILAAWCGRNDVRLIVSLDPWTAGAERFALMDPELVSAVRRLSALLQREARVTDLVLSFESTPHRLIELRDILHYGRDAAPAHADVARRVRRELPKRVRLWLHPARPYTGPWIRAFAGLPTSIGLVWHGGSFVSPTVEAVEADQLRAIVGDRDVLLRDRFPANQARDRMPLSHNLGPLSGRDPGLASRLAGHVSLAMEDWAASRLTLMTVADWLRSPSTYESEPSWERAMRTLAGDHPKALEALRTQALEWGGPPGGRNYRTALDDNPTDTRTVLRDPALVGLWRYTLTRYPERMRHLESLEDRAFRDELLEVMARRLAIARAIPLVREILARRAAGRSDLGGLVASLNRLRGGAGRPTATVALERFLHAAGVLPLLEASEDAPSK